jgi:outer membrane protein TolC
MLAAIVACGELAAQGAGAVAAASSVAGPERETPTTRQSSMHTEASAAATQPAAEQPQQPTREPAVSENPAPLTMERAVMLAQSRSIDAMMARNTFLGSYWNFRAFQASRRPSLNLSANVANFDRSYRPLQDYQSGEIAYRENYNMYNTGSLSINQNIAATGGTLSVASSLSRLDQWAPTRGVTYYTQPVTLSYLQPLWTYNSFKWDKKLEPERYEKAKKEYLEQMESITVKAVQLFFDMLLQRMKLDLSTSNYANTRTMYRIVEQRFALGSVRKADLLQLELRMINDSLAIVGNENLMQSKKMELKSFLGFGEDDDVMLVAPESVPEIVLDHAAVLDRALRNSSFVIAQRIARLEAESEVAHAKSNRGISAQISTQFGLSNSSNNLPAAYNRLLEQEILGISLRVPIMDWGMGRGRVKVAQARMETARNRLEQAVADYRQDVYAQVVKFNSQRSQCLLAKRAKEVSQERYVMTMAGFANGSVSVTELNTAQSENDEAGRKYMTELSNFWSYYFNIRKLSLYDYISATDIEAEYDRIIK